MINSIQNKNNRKQTLKNLGLRSNHRLWYYYLYKASSEQNHRIFWKLWCLTKSILNKRVTANSSHQVQNWSADLPIDDLELLDSFFFSNLVFFSKKTLVMQFSYMEIVWLVFFFQKTKKFKKSKFSVVAAQKTLKCFSSSWIDFSKLFFHKKKLKKC